MERILFDNEEKKSYDMMIQICEIRRNILDKKAFFHYSRIQKKAVKKRSRR